MAKQTIQNDEFWVTLGDLIKFSAPVYYMLRKADTGGPFLPKIYGRMWETVERVRGLPFTEFITSERKANFLQIIEERWTYFHHPVQAAGYNLIHNLIQFSVIDVL